MTKKRGKRRIASLTPQKPGRGLVKGRPHPFTRPESRRPIAIEAAAPAQSRNSGNEVPENKSSMYVKKNSTENQICGTKTLLFTLNFYHYFQNKPQTGSGKESRQPDRFLLTVDRPRHGILNQNRRLAGISRLARPFQNGLGHLQSVGHLAKDRLVTVEVG